MTDLTIKIIAKRFTVSGATEIVAFIATIPAEPMYDKNTLLGEICLTPWGHTPPTQAIADFARQTAGWEKMKDRFTAPAILLNFYELDEEHNQPSIRQIEMFEEAEFDSRVEALQVIVRASNPNADIVVH